MPFKSAVQDLNQEVARKLILESKNNPESAYFGKFVGIANGQVVVVADDWDEVARQLQLAEPDPAKTFCFEAGLDYDEPDEIWEAS